MPKVRVSASAARTDQTEFEIELEELLKIVVSGEPPADYSGRFNLADHVLGLVAIAKGDREDAKDHFEISTEKPHVNIDHYWGEAFLTFLLEDDNWPCENPNMPGNRSEDESALK